MAIGDRLRKKIRNRREKAGEVTGKKKYSVMGKSGGRATGTRWVRKKKKKEEPKAKAPEPKAPEPKAPEPEAPTQPAAKIVLPYVAPQIPVSTGFGGQGNVKPADFDEARRSAMNDPVLFQVQGEPTAFESPFWWDQPDATRPEQGGEVSSENTSDTPLSDKIQVMINEAVVEKIKSLFPGG